MRSVVFRFEDIGALAVALGDARGSLALPEGETVADGEWVLATFEIGSRRRATAAAARGVRAAGDTHLTFERRDWDRLLSFVATRSEHMRVARPIASSSGKLPAAAEARPIAVDPKAEPAASWHRDDSEPPPSSTLGGPFGRVLLVDRDEETRDVVRRMLTEIGLVVEIAAAAEQAQHRLALASFDALVLDFHALGEAPLDFVRALRRDPRLASLPVLFLSSHPSSREVVDAFASGADDVLARPFRASELSARVFGLLRRARFARASSIAPTSTGPRSGGSGA